MGFLPRVVFVGLLAFGLRPAAAQRLGRIDFPTSGTGAAAAQFHLGVLYLHSFEYPSALGAFRAAERIDPRFAMAYWGEAMTYTHPVWNQQDLGAGRAALARLAATPELRQARAPTDREKRYLRAVEALYGEGSKPARDTGYAARMAELAAAYPADDEAQLFHALALLGLSQGDRDVPTYLRAGAIAVPIFERRRDHPGAAHYVIHAFDDPLHAPLGLRAARAYSTIAPDAAHAQHMTSHIFLALGLWDDVVRANEVAIGVLARRRSHGAGPGCGHYSEWLMYGYLQLDRMDDASRVLRSCQGESPGHGDPIESYAGMRAAFLVDAPDPGPYLAEPAAAPADAEIYLAFGTGYAAGRRGDGTAVAAARERVDRAATGLSGAEAAYARILAAELTAIEQELAHEPEAAIASLTLAAHLDDSLPVPFGPPLTAKPPHELLGELFLRQQRWPEAEAAFRAALTRTPNRPAATAGLAKAIERRN
jgi:tetratricopeptide (TPR) repeat protein